MQPKEKVAKMWCRQKGRTVTQKSEVENKQEKGRKQIWMPLSIVVLSYLYMILPN